MTTPIFSTVGITQRNPCIKCRRSSGKSALRIAAGSSGDDGSLSDPSLYYAAESVYVHIYAHHERLF